MRLLIEMSENQERLRGARKLVGKKKKRSRTKRTLSLAPIISYDNNKQSERHAVNDR